MEYLNFSVIPNEVRNPVCFSRFFADARNDTLFSLLFPPFTLHLSPNFLKNLRIRLSQERFLVMTKFFFTIFYSFCMRYYFTFFDNQKKTDLIIRLCGREITIYQINKSVPFYEYYYLFLVIFEISHVSKTKNIYVKKRYLFIIIFVSTLFFLSIFYLY